MDFFSHRNKVDPSKGKLLVSEPFLPDSNFERTIILLCEHNEEGSFGFVLNKPSLAKVADVIEVIKNFDSPVYIGGPVQQDTLHVIHAYPDVEDAVEIIEGVYWGGNFDKIALLAETGQLNLSSIKFLLGYSGWSAGQLNEELNEKSWIVSDKFSQELIFETDPEVMWRNALQALGGKFSMFSNYPVDPRMN